MKKLVLIALALFALQATAQEHRKEHKKGHDKKERAHRMSNFSAEEIATLQTKKMTLHLDLNEAQQAKIQKINLENAKARKKAMEARKAKKESGETFEKPSKEDRVKMMNKKLDHQIAMKKEMKKILNEEQYAKWEKFQSKMAQRKKGKMKDYRKKHHKGKKTE